MTTSVEAGAERQCQSCLGTGEVGTEVGPVDCPDCGGAGALPHPAVMVEWRVRDIERRYEARNESMAQDMRWLIAELRRARTALTDLASLAEDAGESEIGSRMLFIANRALELYPVEVDA
jgi:hypothetical protein